ncbi:MAG: LytTR family DNA-binding domain-containing protein [Bacteroidales bacterium]
MKAIILEDETRAVNHLRRVIGSVAPDVEIVATLESVREATAYLKDHASPELIFSDIQLADGLSFEVFTRIPVDCPLIFTTAYDRYAMEAFDANGIDYLLKPIDGDRLARAMEKVRRYARRLDLEQLLSLQQHLRTETYKSRFMVRVGEQIRSIDAADVLAFYSLDKATFLHTRQHRNYGIEQSLDDLEPRLDPTRFFRINRSHILSIEACEKIYAWSNSRLKLEVEGLDSSRIVVARDRVKSFKEWLDV